jgi:hypothetical protein
MRNWSHTVKCGSWRHVFTTTASVPTAPTGRHPSHWSQESCRTIELQSSASISRVSTPC